MDWKEELDKKFNQLKGGEVQDERISSRNGSNSNLGNRSSSGCIVSQEGRKNLNNNINHTSKGEQQKMITSKGALSDYEDICADTKTSADEKLVKIFKVVIKLLLGIRTNQVSEQKGYNIVDTKKEEVQK